MKNRLIKNLIIMLCIGIMVIPGFAIFETDSVHGAEYEAGGDLIVRVQYDGEREDKIRTKCTFSKSELEQMGSVTAYYTNITRVGGILRIVSYGPTIKTIIENAGIDYSAVKYICFRTTDGTGKDNRYSQGYDKNKYLDMSRYYYPELQNNYERHDDMTITPLEGSLNGAVEVPAMLALNTYGTKADDEAIDEGNMSTEDTYRFCVGQTPLVEGQKTTQSEVVSAFSAKWIFGIDIVLEGTPPINGISLSANKKNVKIGNKIKIKTVIDSEVEDLDNSDLTWSSSDVGVATVDQNGVVKIIGKGSVTITATAPNGVSASIVINGEGGKEDKKDKSDKESKTGNEEKQGQESDSTDKSKNKKEPEDAKTVAETMNVREISIGDKIKEKTPRKVMQQASEDTQALEETEEYGQKTKAVAGIAGGSLFALGMVLRIRRFRIDR